MKNSSINNKYSMGCLKNTLDNRDINIAQVQAPVEVPNEYYTDISWLPVLNQKQLGACVGHAHAIIHIYNEYKENGKIPDLSPRYIYALSKKVDGYAGEGTFPRVSAKIETDKGCATEAYCPNSTDLKHADYINIKEDEKLIADAKPYKMKGYAVVNNNPSAIKQAIINNGLVAVSISVGGYVSPIKKGTLGMHRVTIYGYKGDRFYFRNSWDSTWGDKGNGFFDWADQDLQDIMVFVDMPNELKEKAKMKYKYFSDKEIVGLKPELVKMLDEARGVAGVPFKITSGFRTPEQNAKLKGSVEDSAHTIGLAVDISCPDSSVRFKMIKGLLVAGFTRIGIGKDFLHIDISKDKLQDCIWTYYTIK